MATSADIETALVTAATAAIYPAVGGTFTGKVTIARGWPTEADIRSVVSVGAHLVGVYAVPGMSRDATSILRKWQIGAGNIGAMEVGRIEQIFRLQIWASRPDARDELLGLLLAALKYQLRYTMPDGSVATVMKIQAGGPDDRPSRADEWAQSVDLMLQYPVIYTQPQPVVTQVTVAETINDGLTITTQTS